MEGRVLDFVALGILCFVIITIVYGIIYIHDIPYMIARKRNHPHMDAIHTAGWVSLFLMHTIWPFLWIWATLYKPGYGWGIHPGTGDKEPEDAGVREPEIAQELRSRILQLEQEKKQASDAFEQKLGQLTRRIEQLESAVAGQQQEG